MSDVYWYSRPVHAIHRAWKNVEGMLRFKATTTTVLAAAHRIDANQIVESRIGVFRFEISDLYDAFSRGHGRSFHVLHSQNRQFFYPNACTWRILNKIDFCRQRANEFVRINKNIIRKASLAHKQPEIRNICEMLLGKKLLVLFCFYRCLFVQIRTKELNGNLRNLALAWGNKVNHSWLFGRRSLSYFAERFGLVGENDKETPTIPLDRMKCRRNRCKLIRGLFSAPACYRAGLSVRILDIPVGIWRYLKLQILHDTCALPRYPPRLRRPEYLPEEITRSEESLQPVSGEECRRKKIHDRTRREWKMTPSNVRDLPDVEKKKWLI